MRFLTKCLYYFFVILLEVAFIRCQCGTIPILCPPITDIYRTFDGTCNNVDYPWWGTAYSEYDRIQPACYGDDNSTPRQSQNGDALPNPRIVRLACLPEDHIEKDEDITRVFIPILQYFHHDIIESYKSLEDSSSCCSQNLQILSETPDYCVNIQISQEDPIYTEYNITCLPMAKMINNIDLGCDTDSTVAEQINEATHFMDLSNLYGTSEDENYALRTGEGGKLLTEYRNGFDYLPNDPTGSPCQIQYEENEICYKAGDKRVNQNLDLAIMHTHWTRYHNKIACDMAEIYPDWDDDQIFQETRRILIAIYQKIVFYDVFTWILGDDNMCEHGLTYSSLSHIDDYDSTCKPNILSEFVHAASKGLHPMVVRKLEYVNEDRYAFNDVSMKDSFFRPQCIEQESNFDSLTIGQTTQNPNYQGPNFENDMTNFTYSAIIRYVLDLPAQDIWRARWAGAPSYNDIRAKCGLTKATDFHEFSDSIDPQNIEKLKAVYTNVDDVDLYVGGLLERNYPGAKVGTTFFWIFIRQLLRIRQCDRFWYEHPEAGFTQGQIRQIKEITISGIICENGNNINSMQVDALQPPRGINFPINCQIIRKLDISKWYQTNEESTYETTDGTTYETTPETTYETTYETTTVK